jgi:hypothetical protein
MRPIMGQADFAVFRFPFSLYLKKRLYLPIIFFLTSSDASAAILPDHPIKLALPGSPELRKLTV